MSYQLRHINYACVEFIDPHGAKAVENFINDLLKTYPEKDLKCVLVDARKAEVNDRVYNITEVMGRFESFGVPKHSRIAVLRNSTTSAGKYHDIMKAVVTDLGYNFQLFTDYEAAVSWLGQE